MKSLYLLYYCVVPGRHVFLVSGTLGLTRTCGTMMVMMIDDYEKKGMLCSSGRYMWRR